MVKAIKMAALGWLCFPVIALARPVSYADGWMLMSMNDQNANTQMALYSPSMRYAVGVRTDYLRGQEGWLYSATFNYLLHRWNFPDAQANVFWQSGVGVGDQDGRMGPAAWGGIEADWENRRYYVSYENMAISSSVWEDRFSQKARVGIAPYVGGYDDVHTWLMLQVDHMPANDDEITVTPLVRMFNTYVLGEAGVSHNGDVLFNVTLQF